MQENRCKLAITAVVCHAGPIPEGFPADLPEPEPLTAADAKEAEGLVEVRRATVRLTSKTLTADKLLFCTPRDGIMVGVAAAEQDVQQVYTCAYHTHVDISVQGVL